MERNKRNEIIRLIERSGNRRNFAIVLIMIYTGIRVSECAALDRVDITMSERKGTLTIRNGKGTSLLREGKDVALIQSLTGHSSINMIGRYGRASEDDKEKAIYSLFLKS